MQAAIGSSFNLDALTAVCQYMIEVNQKTTTQVIYKTVAVSPSRNSRNSGVSVANQPGNELFNSLAHEKEE